MRQMIAYGLNGIDCVIQVRYVGSIHGSYWLSGFFGVARINLHHPTTTTHTNTHTSQATRTCSMTLALVVVDWNGILERDTK